MKKNPILTVLLFFLVSTAFFWVQILNIHDLPPAAIASPGVNAGAEAEKFVEMAQELLVDYRQPLPVIHRKDPFSRMEVKQEVAPVTDPTAKLRLSSIVYSKSNAFAVINGKIVAEGDTILNKDSGVKFVVEKIGFTTVELSDGSKKYELELAAKVNSGNP